MAVIPKQVSGRAGRFSHGVSAATHGERSGHHLLFSGNVFLSALVEQVLKSRPGCSAPYGRHDHAQPWPS